MQFTPLCRAAQSGRLAIVERLLLANANVHASNHHNWTPLAEASHHGHPEVAKALLSHSANPESRDHLEYTPLNRAAQAGRLSPIILLLDTGKANINAVNCDGWTSLAEASFHGYPDVVKTLLDRGANVEAKNDDNETALDLAVRKRKKPVVDEFLTHRQGLLREDSVRQGLAAVGKIPSWIGKEQNLELGRNEEKESPTLMIA